MKKGFSLLELVISFAIISIVSLALFRAVLTIQEQEKKEVEYNSFVAFSYTLNKTIQNDFINKKIIEVYKYGTNDYGILYENGSIIRLKVEDNSIVYGTTKEEIPTGYELYSDITITTYKTTGSALNSYLLVNIPLKSTSSKSFSDLNYMYQFNSNTTIVPPVIVK